MEKNHTYEDFNSFSLSIASNWRKDQKLIDRDLVWQVLCTCDRSFSVFWHSSCIAQTIQVSWTCQCNISKSVSYLVDPACWIDIRWTLFFMWVVINIKWRPLPSGQERRKTYKCRNLNIYTSKNLLCVFLPLQYMCK